MPIKPTWRFFYLAGCTLLVFVFLAPNFHHLVGVGLANAGAIQYYQAMSASCTDSLELEDARRFLEEAIGWDGTVARWRELLGLVYNGQGDDAESLRQLRKAVELAPHQSRIWAELGDAYDRVGQSSLAVEAYNKGAPYTDNVRLLVNLLKAAEEHISAGESSPARRNIEQALTLDPNSLWAWSQLSRPLFGPVRDALRHVREYRLFMPDDQLTRFTARAAIDLIERDIWTVDEGLNVVRVLLGRSQPSEAAKVLQVLQAQAPDDARLGSAAAEIAAQLGDPVRAAVLWEQVAKTGAAPGTAWCAAAAQWRASGQWSQAQATNKLCLQAWPDDQLALAGSQETCDQLEDPLCAQEAAGRLTGISLRNSVAQILNLDGNQVVLGPNMVLNGGFEERDWARPWLARYWEIGIWDGFQHDRAAFYVDLDRRSWSGQVSAVLIGLWRKDTELPSGAYAELIGPPILIPGQAAYVLSLYYRTEDLFGLAFLLDGRPESQTFDGTSLPATEQRWRQAVVVAVNPAPQASYIRPQLRLWGLGALWFDEVQVNLLVSPSETGGPFPISIR